MNKTEMIELSIAEGFHGAEVISTDKIVFDASFRPYCEENLCGQYGANYSCPPDCGTPEQMKQRVLAYKKVMIGASGCTLCKPCKLASGEPCEHPDMMYSCMAAYCIWVKKLAEDCNMNYEYKNKILPFFGMYVFD